MNTKRKAINFDLDTKKLKEIYSTQTGKKFNKAYYDIKAFMRANGFSHRQGSGYISDKPMPPSKIASLIKKMTVAFPWLQDCVRRIDVTAIEKQFDLSKSLSFTANDKPTKNNEKNFAAQLEKDTDKSSMSNAPEPETMTISKEEYDIFIKSFEAAAKHAKTISDFNLVLDEHPELKQNFIKAKTETMQRKAERGKGGLNDKSVKDKTSERKPKKHKPKR